MSTMMNCQRVYVSPLTRIIQRWGHTGYNWPPRAFGPQEPPPAIEPSHVRGEGKFLFPASLRGKNKAQFQIPPIKELSHAAKRRDRRQLWHTKVRKLGTVEEKIFELNMPRYYGWRPYVINEGVMNYDPLPKTQYITRTSVVEELGLPKLYDDLLSEEELNATVQQIKGQIEDVLVLEYTVRNQNYQLTENELECPKFMKDIVARAVSKQFNRIMINNLSGKCQHLLEAQVDEDPRLEAFWFFGGFHAPYEATKARSGKSWLEEFKDEPTNQCFQYYGTPMISLRHKLPLNEFMAMEQSKAFRYQIPYEPLDPRVEGYVKELKRATVIPGFWPGDESEFGLISYNSTAHLATRNPIMNDNKDVITSQAILNSFSWLYTQACYQGFSTFQDPTYPLVNQMALTNGQWWTFSVYQLNATSMHIDAINTNEHCNICWMTDSMKLFENIENGKVQGLNEEVLKNLVKFYINKPQVRENVKMKPYLGKEQIVANIDHDERRDWLETKFKYLMSNRERNIKIPEISDWQRIYKIKFNTRPMDKKRDPWEFGINPYQRRLDDHCPPYVPKSLRQFERRKIKFANQYYPHVPEEELQEKNNV